ncbi:ATP-binding cassette transporter, subfamily B, member 14, group MDR/PGP protein PpABCB14 [Planoprotostelium fungivorum]|uniref:ATP-binding cassette transporter, subfamily B, member 14, group MDR/PGP protein PpABCB14 n=1 Tax=Planoprotostelium fungivorum TaxID=1890364 RepID=A0A2P6N2P9_9EUKA|nr:ATP-binding cassette transporter, subfamily B, member 14, group MDR/PGP protein PpABCB14 [Planoprotostelium fungivorum]
MSFIAVDQEQITKDKEDEQLKEVGKNEVVSPFKLFKFASALDIICIILGVLLSIFTGVVGPLQILVFGDVVTDFGPAMANPTTENLLKALLPTILRIVYLGVAMLLGGYLSQAMWIFSGENQTSRIRQKYVHAILRQENGWFDKGEDGSMNTRLANDTQLVQDAISEKMGATLQCLAQFVAGLAVAFTKGWRLALVILGCIPLIIAVGGITITLITRFMTASQDAYAEAGLVAEQALGGIRTVQSYSLQSRFMKRYEALIGRAEKTNIKSGWAIAVGFGSFILILFSFYALAFWYGSRLVRDGTDGMDGGRVLVVILSMVSGSYALMQIPPNLSAFGIGRAAAYKIYRTIDRLPPIDIDEEGNKKLENFQGKIRFRNVRFAYPTRPDTVILENLDLTIPAGKTVAFVGQSGSGKSTVVGLIQRFYDPLGGSVEVDNVDLRSCDLKWLRQQIGVVGQEPVLFNMSIKENLKLGSCDPDSVSDEMIQKACVEANCHSFICSLPRGYDTGVGERGGMLSGGQKQRIAIARALLRNPKILLLDEATSALDTTSERLVQETLDKASVKRTTVVVAHRLSTVRNADLIVVMKKGEIVETGTHDELYAKGGMYTEMVNKQQVKMKKDNLVDPDAVDVVRSNVHADGMRDTCIVMDDYDISPEEKIRAEKKRREKKRAPFVRVLRLMSKEWYFLLFGCIGSSVVGAVFPLYAYVFSKVINLLGEPDKAKIDPGPIEGANKYSLIFVAIGVMGFAGIAVQLLAFEIAGSRVTRRLRAAAFSALLRQEIGFFDHPSHSVGALTASLSTDAAAVNDMITKVWGDVLQLLLSLVVALLISCLHSWRLTLIILGVMPFIILSTAIESRAQEGFEDQTKEAYQRSGETASEAFSEIRTVKALTMEEYWERRYAENIKRPHRLAIRKAFISSMVYGAMQAFTMWANALGFYGGIRLIGANLDQLPDIIVVILCMTITAGGMGRASLFVSKYVKGKKSAVSLFELLDRDTEIDPQAPGNETKQIEGKVNLQRVEFRYPARPDIPIFNGQFHLRASPKQTVALVGASGCGKSTVIGLIQRWYNPLGGEVLVDNRRVADYQVQWLRRSMAVVGQEPVLFNLSIRENIAYGLEEGTMTEDMLRRAAADANIQSFVDSLPEGFDTKVGEKGSQLSGGQKQRIAIARALVRDPKILLLDEATSALDSESEKLVQEAIDRATEGRTTITIAHRLSTIQNADLICVVKDGRIAESGTHNELIELEDGLYRNLVEQQNLNQ